MWEVSWRRGRTATYWPKVLLTIAALLLRPGWAAQPWVTEGRNPSVCKLILMLASCPQLTPTATGTELKLTDSSRLWHLVIYFLMSTYFLWAYASEPNSTTSTGLDDIPRSSTGCTCLTVFLLIYTGASLDWRLGRGSVCYTEDNMQKKKTNGTNKKGNEIVFFLFSKDISSPIFKKIS